MKSPAHQGYPRVGDCGDAGRVTIAELITAVNIGLGQAAVAACRAVDLDGDGTDHRGHSRGARLPP